MVPYMRQYGRTQRRMYAGLTISDPETVTDNSDYPAGQNALPSTGIPFVIMEDTVVVSVWKDLADVYLNQPIRNEIQHYMAPH